MKTPMKASIKVQIITGTPSGMQSRMSNTFKCISLAEYLICNIYTYIQKIPYFHVFLEKDDLSFSVQKKTPITPDNTRKIIFQFEFFWKDHLFGAFEENIIFPCIYLRKIIFHFPSRNKIIFSGKKYHSSR